MDQGTVQVAVNVTEQKEFVHLALAETNARHPELQWRNIGCFINEWCHPGEWEARAQKPGLPVVGVTDWIGHNHKTPWVRGLGSAGS